MAKEQGPGGLPSSPILDGDGQPLEPVPEDQDIETDPIDDEDEVPEE